VSRLNSGFSGEDLGGKGKDYSNGKKSREGDSPFSMYDVAEDGLSMVSRRLELIRKTEKERRKRGKMGEERSNFTETLTSDEGLTSRAEQKGGAKKERPALSIIS